MFAAKPVALVVVVGMQGSSLGSEVSPATKILIAGGRWGGNSPSGCAGGGLEGSDAQCNLGGGGVGSPSDWKGLGFVHSEVLAGETLGLCASSGASYDNIAEPVKSDEFGYVRGYGAGAARARSVRNHRPRWANLISKSFPSTVATPWFTCAAPWRLLMWICEKVVVWISRIP